MVLTHLAVAIEQVEPMKVLIVDDSQPVRRMIASFLDDVVDEFFECEDGSNVLTAYREHRPDVVLMDIKMRRVDGFEATANIKKAFPDARVIVVSQWDTTELRQLAKKSGADAYVSKSNLQPLGEFIESIAKPT